MGHFQEPANRWLDVRSRGMTALANVFGGSIGYKICIEWPIDVHTSGKSRMDTKHSRQIVKVSDFRKRRLGFSSHRGPKGSHDE